MSEKHRFIQRLEGLFDPLDRGALAELRRSAGQENLKAFKYLPANLPKWQEKAALIIAPLFALWHQGKDRLCNPSGNYNLGYSLVKLAQAQAESGRIEDAKKRLEKRFNALLNSHVDDIAVHLRHIMGQLSAREIPVNWDQLLYDIIHWEYEDKFVQKNWARSFWTQSLEEKIETTTEN